MSRRFGEEVESFNCEEFIQKLLKQDEPFFPKQASGILSSISLSLSLSFFTAYSTHSYSAEQPKVKGAQRKALKLKVHWREE